MSNKNKVKTKKTQSGKRDWSFYVLIVSVVILAIPLLYLGYVAISATRNTGAPINGDRFNHDLDPAIQSSAMDSITEKLKAEAGVEDVAVILKTATLRVYVRVPEGTDAATIDAMAKKAYDITTAELDPAVYFTIQDAKKQYDLEIHVYNQLTVTDETRSSYVYELLWKGSNMAEYKTQVLSTALSQDVVDYFHQVEEERDRAKEEAENEANNPDPAPEETNETGEGE